MEGTNARLDKTTRTLHGIGKGQDSHTHKKKETSKPQLPTTPDDVYETPQYALKKKTKGKKSIKKNVLPLNMEWTMC